MSWGTLLAAGLGAVLGVGTTLLTDLVRSRRDSDQRWADVRREVYSRALTALSQTHSRLVRAACQGLAAADREQAVHDAYHNSPLNSDARSVLRELAITAPAVVFELAVPVDRELRVIRDALALNPSHPDSDEYAELVQPYRACLAALQAAMRDDLRPSVR